MKSQKFEIISQRNVKERKSAYFEEFLSQKAQGKNPYFNSNKGFTTLHREDDVRYVLAELNNNQIQNANIVFPGVFIGDVNKPMHYVTIEDICNGMNGKIVTMNGIDTKLGYKIENNKCSIDFFEFDEYNKSSNIKSLSEMSMSDYQKYLDTTDDIIKPEALKNADIRADKFRYKCEFDVNTQVLSISDVYKFNSGSFQKYYDTSALQLTREHYTNFGVTFDRVLSSNCTYNNTNSMDAKIKKDLQDESKKIKVKNTKSENDIKISFRESRPAAFKAEIIHTADEIIREIANKSETGSDKFKCEQYITAGVKTALQSGQIVSDPNSTMQIVTMPTNAVDMFKALKASIKSQITEHREELKPVSQRVSEMKSYKKYVYDFSNGRDRNTPYVEFMLESGPLKDQNITANAQSYVDNGEYKGMVQASVDDMIDIIQTGQSENAILAVTNINYTTYMNVRDKQANSKCIDAYSENSKLHKSDDNHIIYQTDDNEIQLKMIDHNMQRDKLVSSYDIIASKNSDHAYVHNFFAGIAEPCDKYIKVPKSLLSNRDEYTVIDKITKTITMYEQGRLNDKNYGVYDKIEHGEMTAKENATYSNLKKLCKAKQQMDAAEMLYNQANIEFE